MALSLAMKKELIKTFSNRMEGVSSIVLNNPGRFMCCYFKTNCSRLLLLLTNFNELL
uniref:Uncharacterized protein n=1 Tax=Arion vulgaris TaxID=1028688 RepID=A0A0B6Z5J6_9EUPU